MTPVMVPGLAAKRISGVSDCFDFDPGGRLPTEHGEPHPRQHPAARHHKGIQRHPKYIQELLPEERGDREDDQDRGRPCRVVDLPLSDCPATARANIAAQIAGLISESTVMMA